MPAAGARLFARPLTLAQPDPNRRSGTKFGLAPGSTARTASVLASLPPVARFPYGSLRPGEGCSPQEANCYAVLKEPKEWVRQ